MCYTNVCPTIRLSLAISLVITVLDYYLKPKILYNISYNGTLYIVYHKCNVSVNMKKHFTIHSVCEHYQNQVNWLWERIIDC